MTKWKRRAKKKRETENSNDTVVNKIRETMLSPTRYTNLDDFLAQLMRVLQLREREELFFF